VIFTQLAFLGFFLVTASVHWALQSNRARKLWLLATSYYFYSCWDYRFLALIFASTVLDYATALALSRPDTPRIRRLLITGSLCANLGILGFFKYYNFFIGSGAALLSWFGWSTAAPTLSIVLPVGVSFFTFQSMSFTVDVYRGKLPAHRDFLDFALFVSFFPQLVAGPIVRASAFLPQLESTRSWLNVNVRRALLLFVVGYFKKACIADNIAAAIDPLYESPTSFGVASRVLGAVLYSIQIYCDFSGYTDMATGVAALIGYDLAKNFDAPYLSCNVRDFWQRWHISLSSWLRDYLYISLGGNRGGEPRVARNLMLTMLLGGLWHGANWTFVIWGFLHGAALVAHRSFHRIYGRAHAHSATSTSWVPVASWALTFAWVVFCFTIFRCVDFPTAWRLFTAATDDALPVSKLSPVWWLIVAVLGGVHFLLWRRRAQVVLTSRALPDVIFYPALGAACAFLIYFTALNTAPFIYFQF
jgi:alginate O-acetyltransferase complex protein AlgI